LEMTDHPFNLNGKLVLVTGAGTGIGRGIALEVARQGADVVLHYSSSAVGAQSAVEEILALGRRATALPGNLVKVAECRRIVDTAAEFLGGLDGVVNNAGITNVVNFLDVTEEHYDFIYNLNIRGQFFVTQQAVHHILQRGAEMKRQRDDQPWAGGTIINVSSVHGLVGYPGHSVYAGTKGAINAFSRELAVELCPLHIRPTTSPFTQVTIVRPATASFPGGVSGCLKTLDAWQSTCFRMLPSL
jgi:NAD(P)-dependent dehydrogenase (short-subunit alcohol dehydrogenase family)